MQYLEDFRLSVKVIIDDPDSADLKQIKVIAKNGGLICEEFSDEE